MQIFIFQIIVIQSLTVLAVGDAMQESIQTKAAF